MSVFRLHYFSKIQKAGSVIKIMLCAFEDYVRYSSTYYFNFTAHSSLFWRGEPQHAEQIFVFFSLASMIVIRSSETSKGNISIVGRRRRLLDV